MTRVDLLSHPRVKWCQASPIPVENLNQLRKSKMTKPIIPGPTYAEMRKPLLLPPFVRQEANDARSDELNPINLFNINWKNTGDSPERIVLAKELTGVQ